VVAPAWLQPVFIPPRLRHAALAISPSPEERMPTPVGSFTVKITPQAAEAGVGDPSIGRMGLHKRFEGGLRGEAHGQMLAMRTPVDGSAVYVALDRFEGELDGRRGGFALHHRGVMDAGVAALEVWVAPIRAAASWPAARPARHPRRGQGALLPARLLAAGAGA
jgi:hypothetical protein